jgi:hypothetical protein
LANKSEGFWQREVLEIFFITESFITKTYLSDDEIIHRETFLLKGLFFFVLGARVILPVAL